MFNSELEKAPKCCNCIHWEPVLEKSTENDVVGYCKEQQKAFAESSINFTSKVLLIPMMFSCPLFDNSKMQPDADFKSFMAIQRAISILSNLKNQAEDQSTVNELQNGESMEG